MNGKAIRLGLLFFAVIFCGCAKSDTATQSNAEQKSLGAWHPGDKVSYKWPAAFKLPLEIQMKAPEVSEKIWKPSPPLSEAQKAKPQPGRSLPWPF